MSTLPKWLRGIMSDRGKLMGRRNQNAPKHDSLLDIHRPAISPYMARHPRFVLWFVTKLLKP